MPPYRLVQQGHQIILLGDFNPKIFQPAWFGAQGLIAQSEAENAKIQVVHAEVVIFSLEDWLTLQVTRERFAAATTQVPYAEVMRDLVLGTFEALRHTPLRMMGINRDAHYGIESFDLWHSVGHRLAPKKIWGDILVDPGMNSLTIQGKRPDNFDGAIRVTVEPSAIVYPGPGLFLRVNDHFEYTNLPPGAGADDIMNILRDQWDVSYKRADSIIEKVLERTTHDQSNSSDADKAP